jgi:hypothetical protein
MFGFGSMLLDMCQLLRQYLIHILYLKYGGNSKLRKLNLIIIFFVCTQGSRMFCYLEKIVYSFDFKQCCQNWAGDQTNETPESWFNWFNQDQIDETSESWFNWFNWLNQLRFNRTLNQPIGLLICYEPTILVRFWKHCFQPKRVNHKISS